MTRRANLMVYCTKQEVIIDFVHDFETPEEAIERLAHESTALVAIDFKIAVRRMLVALTRPQAITLDEWNRAINGPPPLDWQQNERGESFKMDLFVDGDDVPIYVKLDARPFMFHGDFAMPHDECCRKILYSEAFKSPQAPSSSHSPGEER